MARVSTVESGRMVSSRSSTVIPFMSVTGTTERANRPSCHAAAARRWLCAAKRSSSARLNPSRVAIRSAETPCGTKSVAREVAGSMAHAPPSEPMGTRDMDSTPPATSRDSQPERMRAAAWFTASSPEAQNRFSCTPATVCGRPALRAATRGRTAPWSPTGLTQPRIMSSMSAGSSPSWRSRSAWVRPTTRSIGLTSWREPEGLPAPRGVRRAS